MGGWFRRGSKSIKKNKKHPPPNRKNNKKTHCHIYGQIFMIVRRNVITKALLRVQFLPALGGRGWEEQEASALLSKKGVGREGSIESQQKFDFFCNDITP